MENSTQAVTVTAKKYGKKIGIAVLTVIMVLWLASLIFSGAYADEHPELELLLQESARIIPELKQAKEEALKWNNRLETLQQEFFDNSEKLKQYTEADTGNNEFFHTNEGEKTGESITETPLFPESGNFKKTQNGGIHEFLQVNGAEDVKGLEDIFVSAGKVNRVTPELLVCIAQADSSLGKALKTANNIGNVGNNDKNDRVAFDFMEMGINKIGLTLNNQYMKGNTVLGHLSQGGRNIIKTKYDCSSAPSPYKCYASSEYNWNKNVKACLRDILKDNSIDENYQFRIKNS